MESFQGIAASTTPVLVQLDAIKSHHFSSNVQGYVGWILTKSQKKIEKIENRFTVVPACNFEFRIWKS